MLLVAPHARRLMIEIHHPCITPLPPVDKFVRKHASRMRRCPNGIDLVLVAACKTGLAAYLSKTPVAQLAVEGRILAIRGFGRPYFVESIKHLELPFVQRSTTDMADAAGQQKYSTESERYETASQRHL